MKSFDIAYLLNVPNLTEYILKVDKKLVEVLSSGNPHLDEPIKRLRLAGGKRLRTSLVIAIVKNQGSIVNKKVINCCAAIELVHLASLVHDDIVDNAETRRGVPTVNYKEGTNSAIIVGDYLFAKAYTLAATVSSEVAAIIGETIEQLSSGEIYDMADEFDLSRSINSLMKAIQGKTAALLAASCKIAGICAGLPKSSIDALARYGSEFGVSFQIIDDLLDLISNSVLLGKPVGNDIKDGVYTLPIIIGLAGEDGQAIKGIIGKSGQANLPHLIDILLSNGSISQSVAAAKRHNKAAMSVLSHLGNNQPKQSLVDLPDNYLRWALTNFVDNKYKKSISRILGEPI